MLVKIITFKMLGGNFCVILLQVCMFKLILKYLSTKKDERESARLIKHQKKKTVSLGLGVGGVHKFIWHSSNDCHLIQSINFRDNWNYQIQIVPTKWRTKLYCSIITKPIQIINVPIIPFPSLKSHSSQYFSRLSFPKLKTFATIKTNE